MERIERRQLLQLAAGGLIGASSGANERFEDRFIGRSDGSKQASSTGDEFSSRADQSSNGDEPSGELDAFDGSVHGFGFSNWTGNSGTDVYGEEFTYEPTDVTMADVELALDESWSTAVTEAQKHIMKRIVYSWIGGNAATNGHCYGMMLAAAYYYTTPSELPPVVDSASEIPRPVGRYDDVGNRIRRLQTSQILHAEPFWYAFLGLRWGLADHRESLKQIKDTVDSTGTAGIALDGESNAHQVLAHSYEQHDGVTDVFLYDPTYEAVEHRGTGNPWTLSVETDSGTVLSIDDDYEEFLFHNPDMDVTVVDRITEGRDSILEHLSNALFLGLSNAQSLNLDVAEGILVDRPTAASDSSDHQPYADAAVVFGELDEFTIEIDGQSDSEYSLDVFGLRDGETVLDEVVSDTLDEVPSNIKIAIDEAGESAIQVIEETTEKGVERGEAVGEAVEEAGETAGEAIDEAEQSANESIDGAEETEEHGDNGVRWVEDNWLLAAAGSALGLGVGYRILDKRFRNNGENS